jgi:predicted polyphosphate/ATP-dependent NAD kinase
MKAVGIIANPASGKDIRRLVAYGSIFENHEKVNIVKRMLMAMDSVGVREVIFMPDYFGIGSRALRDLDVKLSASFLDIHFVGTQKDSTLAARMMSEKEVGVIVTLGGDGTNRVVAKSCGEIPLLPVSTGTNNVFPFMVEGTLAGMAAGIMAMERFPSESLCNRLPRLEIYRHTELIDIALVDIAVSKAGFLGSRAVWDASTLREIYLTRSEPGNIGLSSIGGQICPIPSHSGKGLRITVGPGGYRVKAPIAPGKVDWVNVQSYRLFDPFEEIPLSRLPAVIALDGERELDIPADRRFHVRLNPSGPWVVNMQRVLRKAAEERLFVEEIENIQKEEKMD